MKIQCDVCNKEAASLFCCADEAALCQDCDQGIHHANKLAGKHRRFSLEQTLPSRQTALCDICKEKRAFLFCQEDRAILCPDCDTAIHTANELTARHNRFFLTGIKLVAASATNPPALKASSKPVSEAAVSPATSSPMAAVPDNCNNKGEVGGTTSISDYLINGIPGWHVEELLDNNGSGFTDSLRLSSLDSLFKTDEMLKYMEPHFGCDFGYAANSALPPVICQVPNISLPVAQNSGVGVHGFRRTAMDTKAGNDQMGVRHHSKSRLLCTDNGFTVPQMGPFPPKRGRWC